MPGLCGVKSNDLSLRKRTNDDSIRVRGKLKEKKRMQRAERESHTINIIEYAD